MNARRIAHLFATSAACIIPAAVLIFLLLFGGCGEPEPIRVGFVGCMTGRLSDLGVAGRNGVILAMEEQEAMGGIQGRPLILITRDDEQDPEVALKVDRELIDQGVVAVIGHMTSAMTMAALPLINREGILMISPSTTTNQLNGLDDGLIRIMAPNRAEIEHLSRHAYVHLGLRNMAAAYDLSNRAYSEDFVQNFKTIFEGLGGRLDQAIPFTSRPGLDFTETAFQLIHPERDGLLVVAGAMDTAMICQHVRMQGVNLPIISSGWGMTDDLIHHGGKAVEGVVFSHLLDLRSREDRYVSFKNQYSDRFGTEPTFAAVHAYEAAHMLFDGLEKTLNPFELKQAILEQKTFFGVQGDFRLDTYGDPERKRFLTTVRQGEYETME